MPTTFHESAGLLALVNVFNLVAAVELAAEDLLIGLLPLKQMIVNTNSISEKRRYVLGGADCLQVEFIPVH